jgi:hypothetical protein
MDDTERDKEWADQIGKTVSIVFLVILFAIFAYGFLGYLVVG